jgi:hypothetical protein
MKRLISMGVIIVVCLFIQSCKSKSDEKPIEKTIIDVPTNSEDNTLTREEEGAGWKLLFDGKTMAGWRMYQNKEADAWDVKNGELYCKGSVLDKSDLRADIITDTKFQNYELSVDWKISPEGNSGIMYHVSEEYDAAYLSGPEYQLIDDIGFPEKLEDWQKTGSDYAMYSATSRPTKPVGEYNTTKILVYGNHREHWLNGEKILEFESWTQDWLDRKSKSKWKDVAGYGKAKKGHICLQDHGGGVWFKNIKIKQL